MPFKTSLSAGVCVAALLTGAPAAADLSASDVWQSWKDNLALYGEDGVSIGSEDLSGDTLTVSDLVLSMQEDSSSVTVTIEEITFTENGDGTVSIVMSDTIPIEMDDAGTLISITATQSGAELVASGDPDAMNMAVTADQYVISVDRIVEYDEEVPADIRFTMNDIDGSYSITESDLRDLGYALSVASADLLIDVSEPESNDAALVSGRMEGLTANALITLPKDADFDNPETILGQGLSLEGGYGLTGSTYIFDIKDGSETAAGTASTGPVEVGLLVNEDRISYDVATSDLDLQLQAAELPFPVSVSLARYGLGFNMPVSSTDAPAPFSARFDLTEVTVNDEIWMMGDPTGQLPHDPVTARIDLSGEARLFYDLMDPEQAEQLAMADVPGEIHSVSLDELTISAVGASVDGSGGFTFDNSDMQTIPGVPRPEGQVTVNINGANRLIDTLVDMGLVPADQAGMGRMMMGMFARTVGDDQLTSTIEINEQGHILANGQRIR